MNPLKMPLKRIYCRNEGKRLHQRAGSGYFAMLVDYQSGSPRGSPDALPRATEERSHNLPPFAPQIQKYFYFCPVEVSQIPDKTLYHSKK